MLVVSKIDLFAEFSLRIGNQQFFDNSDFSLNEVHFYGNFILVHNDYY